MSEFKFKVGDKVVVKSMGRDANYPDAEKMLNKTGTIIGIEPPVSYQPYLLDIPDCDYGDDPDGIWVDEDQLEAA